MVTMARKLAFIWFSAFLGVSILACSNGLEATAQDGSQATVSALETRVAKQATSIAKRDAKIDQLRNQIATMQANAPEQAPTSEPAAESGSDSTYLGGPGVALLPAGTAGKVEVVLAGVYDGNTLPIIVRNNTDADIADLKVSATAKTASGDLIAAGGDQGFRPNVVTAGSYGIGYLYFDGAALPGDATFEFNVTYEKPGGRFVSALDLTYQEANFLGDRIVGVMKNDHDETVTGPLGIAVACLGADGSILEVQQGYADQEEVPAGGTVPFQVSFYSGVDCSAFVLAGSGYNF